MYLHKYHNRKHLVFCVKLYLGAHIVRSGFVIVKNLLCLPLWAAGSDGACYMSVKQALVHMVNPAKESSSVGISKSSCQEYDEGHGNHFPTAQGVEVSGLAKSDRCTLLAEQPQIGTIITESRYVIISLIINRFPVCLWVTVVPDHREHWKPWGFVEAVSCRRTRSILKLCSSAVIYQAWTAQFFFFNNLLL